MVMMTSLIIMMTSLIIMMTSIIVMMTSKVGTGYWRGGGGDTSLEQPQTATIGKCAFSHLPLNQEYLSFKLLHQLVSLFVFCLFVFQIEKYVVLELADMQLSLSNFSVFSSFCVSEFLSFCLPFFLSF